ncbi:MAG: methyltransferase domain-containing protein [Candidatus Omnitrophica bacterium]|nr:methyltransferase domain-containing protein [Candidatus Omnitrophota bacterium]
MQLLKRSRRALGKVKKMIQWAIVKNRIRQKSRIEKAIEWLKGYYPGTAEAIGHKRKRAAPLTQDTAGGLIASLYNFGEKDFARKLAKWGASVQREDGAFSAQGKGPSVFNTAQAIRGFLAVLDDMPELESNLRRASEYVFNRVSQDGSILDESNTYEYRNIYILPPLLEAGKKLLEPKYIRAARRSMDYYRRKPDLLGFNPEMRMAPYYSGFIIEALADLGETQLAKKGLKRIFGLQRRDGSIPAYPGVRWICPALLAQLAAVSYRLGESGAADKVMEYIHRLQNHSGGFYGSYGIRPGYSPRNEIPLAVKSYLDAYYWKIKASFNQEVGIYRESISEEDGRVKEIVSFMDHPENKKILDIGCGKGRFIRALKKQWPKAQFYGMDLSEEMLKSCPEGVDTKCGTLLNASYPDAFFDCVYSVEALEHALLIENAIQEMVRVLKPGGKIIVIDKNIAKIGRLEIKPWERWFDMREVADIFKRSGVEADFKTISYGNRAQPDGLFVAWEGTKR